jgi:hypothetical protein
MLSKERHQTATGAKLAQTPEEDPNSLHSALAQVYSAKIRALADSFNNEETKVEAIALLRGVVSEVRLHPDETEVGGNLGVIRSQKRQNPPCYGRGVGFIGCGRASLTRSYQEGVSNMCLIANK